MKIPEIDITTVQGRVNRLWNKRTAVHHIVVAENGSGKTFLITRGILPLCAEDRVLILDVKGDDEVWENYGEPIYEMEYGLCNTGNGPSNNWYRLVVDPITEKEQARKTVKRALQIVQDEGYWIIVVDESRAITDLKELNLRADLESTLNRGRSRSIQAILGAQSIDYMIGGIRNQWAFGWIGSLRDEVQIKRVLQIVGLPHSGKESLIQTVNNNPKRRWLYVDKESDGKTIAWTRAHELERQPQ
jgi:hypothetical protein